MKVSGRGDLFLADAASDVSISSISTAPTASPSMVRTSSPSTRPDLSIARVQGAGALGNGMFDCASPAAAGSPSPPTARQSYSTSTPPTYAEPRMRPWPDHGVSADV